MTQQFRSGERTDQWPRVHTCLRNWCPNEHDDCKRCDAVLALLLKNREARPTQEGGNG